MNPLTWYIPSFNGDIRFEAETEDRTIVKIIEPTAGEIARLKALTFLFQPKGWVEHPLWNENGDPKLQTSVVKAPILDVAKHLVQDYAPGRATLTAIKFKDESVEAFEAGTGFWTAMKLKLRLDKTASRAVKPVPLSLPEPVGDTYREETALAKKEETKPAKKKPEKAVTVKRHTICCPMCIEGPISPAAEVLFSFLTEDEKQEYIENDHSLVVYGGITGRPYLLSHRHGKWARRQGKICRDLQDGVVLHFHDHTVPPEEELLAAKLLLEHREHWLRTYGAGVYPCLHNPFGDGNDGTRSTGFTYKFGEVMTDLEEIFTGKDPKRVRGFTCPAPGGWS